MRGRLLVLGYAMLLVCRGGLIQSCTQRHDSGPGWCQGQHSVPHIGCTVATYKRPVWWCLVPGPVITHTTLIFQAFVLQVPETR
jgi:hypothetical protein